MDVILFHHAQGLTDGVIALADRLRAAGHTVHTPDLYEGRTFTDLDDGVSHARDTGFGEIIERGVRAAEPLAGPAVYIGVSLGVLPAQRLAQTRADARGAVLLEACVPPAELGTPWPPAVPVQIHGMDHDPSFAGEGDLDAARALVEEAPAGELFLYPGDGHLFTDSSLPSYDDKATTQVVERVLTFLARS
ncbi:dienelactone hydrolase family protein [Actinoplanes sp. NPDC049265]|uniref:dienelactone hydrolase family protein n=1 Tax=Actinoplanes sp. NPDC049265 TaxID=3363902 RepID=UPI0037219846